MSQVFENFKLYYKQGSRGFMLYLIWFIVRLMVYLRKVSSWSLYNSLEQNGKQK
jgi:hypothetical protein